MTASVNSTRIPQTLNAMSLDGLGDEGDPGGQPTGLVTHKPHNPKLQKRRNPKAPKPKTPRPPLLNILASSYLSLPNPTFFACSYY